MEIYSNVQPNPSADAVTSLAIQCTQRDASELRPNAKKQSHISVV